MSDLAQRRQWSLSQWLSWQEQSHPKSWDLGLARIGQVWQQLGAPRLAQHIVIVAGTNGKGSCVRWGEAVAMAHDISVATFTSPHLLDYRERIRFQGIPIDEEALCAAFRAVDVARGAVSLTFFEWSALAAFYVMSQRSLALAILEVGLGGRLDATNIIDADAAIITRIGLDHVDWLGNTVEAIGYEKAGVMRAKQLVVLADEHPPQSVLSYAAEQGAEVWRQQQEIRLRDDGECWSFTTPAAQFSALPYPQKMPGVHQQRHFAAVVAVLSRWFVLTQAQLSRVLCATAHDGRMMLRQRQHHADVLFDVAHNADSAEMLAQYLANIAPRYRHLYGLCSMLNDKDHQAVFAHLRPHLSTLGLFDVHSPRATPAAMLYNAALAAGIEGEHISLFDDADAAWRAVEHQATAQDLIVVTGSFVTVSEILSISMMS